MIDFPPNLAYHRRFADPRSRPSNERADLVVEHTRRQVADLARFIDEMEAERDGEVVAEAWAVLHPLRVMRVDPGE